MASGCKSPDEVYLNESEKKLFIIEKKFQQTSGSVDEKIQTGVFKKFHFYEIFPDYTIEYAYCLSDWFKKKEYISVLKYLKLNNIKIFFGKDKNYKKDLIDFLNN